MSHYVWNLYWSSCIGPPAYLPSMAKSNHITDRFFQDQDGGRSSPQRFSLSSSLKISQCSSFQVYQRECSTNLENTGATAPTSIPPQSQETSPSAHQPQIYKESAPRRVPLSLLSHEGVVITPISASSPSPTGRFIPVKKISGNKFNINTWLVHHSNISSSSHTIDARVDKKRLAESVGEKADQDREMELAHPFPSRPRKAFLRPRYHHSLHSSDFAQEQTTSSGLKDSKSQPWIEWESKSREKVGSSINRNLRACDIFLPTRDDIVAPCPQKQVSHPLRDKLNDRMDSDSQWTFKGEEVIGETTLYGNRLHSSRSSKSLLRGVALSVNHNESIGCVTRDINDEFSPQGIPITPTEEESNDNVNQRRALNLINHEFGSKLSKSIGCVTPPKWSRFVRL